MTRNWDVEVVTRRGGKVVDSFAVVDIGRSDADRLRRMLGEAGGCKGPLLELPKGGA